MDPKDSFVCTVCAMVMVEPTSGCKEGHCLCKACYGSWLAEHSTCPFCRSPTKEGKLVRNRYLQESIAEARVRCKNAGGEGEPSGKNTGGDVDEPPAKLPKKSRAIPVAVAAEQGGRGLEMRGCSWLGTVDEFWGHVESCGWEPVECARLGCGVSVLRKDAAEHNRTTCAFRRVPCAQCNKSKAHAQLAKHESRCPRATLPCPNEGCGAILERQNLGEHREGCAHEKVECPGPRCGATMLQADVGAHMDASMAEHLWALMRKVSRQEREIAQLKAQNSQLQNRMEGNKIRRVFTWGSASGDPCRDCLYSERQLFCKGVAASCFLYNHGSRQDFGIVFHGSMQKLGGIFVPLRLRVGVHATVSILDANHAAEDQLNISVVWGSVSSPDEIFSTGDHIDIKSFTLTDEEKALALCEDGPIKLRAVVDVYLLDSIDHHRLAHDSSGPEELSSPEEESGEEGD